jgi:hypothetical protein
MQVVGICYYDKLSPMPIAISSNLFIVGESSLIRQTIAIFASLSTSKFVD